MKRNGFTLLELLIALMIFSLLSGAAYRLFVSVSQTQQTTVSHLKYLDQWQRFRLLLENDLLQVTLRPVRDESGLLQPALVGNSDTPYQVQFTRSGWRNPLGVRRSTLQRVAYGVNDGELVRYYWTTLDRATANASDEPQVHMQPLLQHVTDVQWQFLDHQQQWHHQWPPSGWVDHQQTNHYQTLLAAAIKLQLQHQQLGNVSIVIPTPAGQVSTSGAAG
ncbi:type II secretion system minor pseudopilin GspJ [Endozoicomonas acroporae]|uniref:type II secretion system minor pseudopilin GspJ n=1 Tax=Endozoicomonas acroporae TaxID=1701104 RepID=UPI000C7746CA|nr:type II secretion system minor pseudopilin GspJ [Endozoicomonas acroporae]